MPSTPHLAGLSRTVAAVAVLAACAGAQAATVSWSAAASITSNGDIVNPCTAVRAIDYGGSAAGISTTDVSAGGCTLHFSASQGNFASQYYGGGYLFNESGKSVDTSFNRVLDTIGYTDSPTGTASQVFTGLEAGATYTVQIFSSDNGGDRWNTVVGIGGTTTIIGTNASTSQYVVGTVRLGAAETGFTLDLSGASSGPLGTSSRTGPLVNALVLSHVPEPGSLALGALALGLLAATRRRPDRLSR